MIDTLFEYCMLCLTDYLDQGRLLEVDENTDEETCRQYACDIVRKQIEFYQKNPKMLHFVVKSKSSFYLSADIKKGRFKRNKPIYHFLDVLVKRKIIKPIEVNDIATFLVGIMYEFLKESVMFEKIKLDDAEIDKLTEVMWAGLKYRKDT